jgi:hypothetical protein
MATYIQIWFTDGTNQELIYDGGKGELLDGISRGDIIRFRTQPHLGGSEIFVNSKHIMKFEMVYL